jgi:molybdopterin biosynthesis enzyme MoaB
VRGKKILEGSNGILPGGNGGAGVRSRDATMKCVQQLFSKK